MYVHALYYMALGEHQTIIIASPSFYKNTLLAEALTLSTTNILILVLHCLSLSLLFWLCIISATNLMSRGCECQHPFPKVNHILLRLPHGSNTVNEFEFIWYTIEFVFINLSA